MKCHLKRINSYVNSPLPLLMYPPGIANEQKKLYGTQFHPEVDLTERGTEMLRNFLFEIAGCTSTFTVQNRQQVCIDDIKEKVKKSKVLVSKTAQRFMNVCLLIQTFLGQTKKNKSRKRNQIISQHI